MPEDKVFRLIEAERLLLLEAVAHAACLWADDLRATRDGWYQPSDIYRRRLIDASRRLEAYNHPVPDEEIDL